MVESENDDLRHIEEIVASINHDSAEAINRSTGLRDRPGPGIGLRNLRHDLMDVFAETARALDQVERALDSRDAAYDDTPRAIIRDHADRLKEQYDGPVLNIALMLLEANRREWLHRKEGTNGAQAVRRHGLTENQRSWLNELQDAYQAADAGGGRLMASHMWERWDAKTQHRMADEMLFHGAARARLVKKGLALGEVPGKDGGEP